MWGAMGLVVATLRNVFGVPLVGNPLGDRLLFIFAITPRGTIVLMSSHLTLSPTIAIELYCVSPRIETG